MNAYSAFFSTARRNDERSNWINGKEKQRQRERMNRGQKRGRERERGHSQIIGYNGEGCDE